MWIFTKYGFFSVVCARVGEDPGARVNPERVMIRARDPSHLFELRNAFQDQLGAEPVIKTPNGDYGWRMIVDKWIWAKVLEMMAEQTDYDNFKNEVDHRYPKTEAFEKAKGLYIRSLHDVWSRMARLQWMQQEVEESLEIDTE